MLNLSDILRKHTEITKIIYDWGYSNPRLFKGIFIKEGDYVLDELHNLNFLVDEVFDEANKRMVELDLERLLDCKVVVTLEDEFNEESKYKIKEAIPFDKKSDLITYFGNEWQFNDLKLTEKELSNQKHAYENLDFIKNSLLQERRNKRKRDEKTLPSEEPDLLTEEKVQIDEIEGKVKRLSPRAREELYARLQWNSTSKLITGLS